MSEQATKVGWDRAGVKRRAEASDPVSNFMKLKDEALDESADSGLEGGIGGKQDAYRHALWTAKMTKRYGSNVARLAGVANEALGAGFGLVIDGAVPVKDSLMDLKNNERGIAIAKESKDEREASAKLRAMADKAASPATYSEAWDAAFGDELVELPPEKPSERR